jgi:Tfp pilus assembly protein FimT
MTIGTTVAQSKDEMLEHPAVRSKVMKQSNRINFQDEAGKSVLDILITLVVVAIVSSFAVVGVVAARDSMRLSNSARVLTAYMEKTRLAAIRCHCSTTLQISTTGSYSVSGPLRSATTETMTLPLDTSVTFQGLTLPLTITFDWRGRADNDYHLTLSNSQGTRTVDLSGGGDIITNSSATYSYSPTIQANLPTNLSDAAADSYVTSYANNNTNTPVVIANPKNHKKPKK